MDIDVDLFRGDLQEQQREGKHALRHHALVRAAKGLLNQAVADEPAVHEDID